VCPIRKNFGTGKQELSRGERAPRDRRDQGGKWRQGKPGKEGISEKGGPLRGGSENEVQTGEEGKKEGKWISGESESE